MTRKVKQVTNLDVKPVKIKRRLRDNLNELVQNEPEALNATLYDVPEDNKTLSKEELYKAPKEPLSPKFNPLYTSVEQNKVDSLGTIYNVEQNDDVIILDNVNEPVNKVDKSIKNQKINTKSKKNTDSINGDTINLNNNSNRQTLINQLISDNQQIISPIFPSAQDL